MSQPPRLITVGVIAAEVGVSVDRVCRILRSRSHIRPSALAGTVRLFDNAAIAQVRDAVDAIDARHARRGGGDL